MTVQESRSKLSSLGWLLAQHAGTRPEHTAIEYNDGRVSYSALWRMAGQCAAYLLEHSEPGDRISVQLPNSPELAAILYACYLTERVAVALHADARAPSVAAALKDCCARLLIHPDQWRLPEPDQLLLASCARLTPVEQPFRGDAATLRPHREPAEGLARLVYTSGTTGAPKAVQLSHRNLASNAQAISDYLALTDTDRGLCQLPFTYAYGNSMLDSHLVAGATLILEAQAGFPARLAEALAQHRATGFSAVAATYVLLLESGALPRQDLRNLRYVTQAGSRMPPERLAQLQSALGEQVSIFAMYGQTEATSRLSYLAPDRLAAKPGSVGRAIADTEIEIWDDQDQPVAAEVIGEVMARGPSIMLGYWRQPEATAETLTQDGWLRTGDLGYIDAEGDLFITGRKREMIKSGAHRIAPAEVEEAAQAAAPDLLLAAVGTPDPVLGERIQLAVHWPLPDDGAAQRQLRQRIMRHCKQQLPLFKMPQDVRFVASWPQTESGKLKRAELASIVADQLSAGR